MRTHGAGSTNRRSDSDTHPSLVVILTGLSIDRSPGRLYIPRGGGRHRCGRGMNDLLPVGRSSGMVEPFHEPSDSGHRPLCGAARVDVPGADHAHKASADEREGEAPSRWAMCTAPASQCSAGCAASTCMASRAAFACGRLVSRSSIGLKPSQPFPGPAPSAATAQNIRWVGGSRLSALAGPPRQQEASGSAALGKRHQVTGARAGAPGYWPRDPSD